MGRSGVVHHLERSMEHSRLKPITARHVAILFTPINFAPPTSHEDTAWPNNHGPLLNFIARRRAQYGHTLRNRTYRTNGIRLQYLGSTCVL